MHRLSEACRRIVLQMQEAGAEFDTTMTPIEMREAASARPVATPPDIASVRDVDAGGVNARLYHPRGVERPPLVLYFHGGGWVLQFTDGHDTTARNLANKSGCAVLAVDYRLAPEHPFPAAFDDSLRATEWAAQRLHELGCRTGPIGLIGDSAGGNLAAAVAVACAERTLEVGALALVYPAVDADTDRHASYAEYSDAPILPAELMRWFWGQYAAEAAPGDWRLSPLHAESLASIPPTAIVAAEIDPLRSEGTAFAERLRADDVEVSHHTIPGTFHAFFGFVDDLEESRTAQRLIADHLARLTG